MSEEGSDNEGGSQRGDTSPTGTRSSTGDYSSTGTYTQSSSSVTEATTAHGPKTGRRQNGLLGEGRSWTAADSPTDESDLYGPHLRVLSLNAYLVPPSVSWNPYLWAAFWSCKRAHQRAEDIGRLAAQYDIVCLQEVWGTNMGAMNAQVLPTHSILPETQTGSKVGWIGEMVDPVRFYMKKTGGLWFAWRRSKCSFISMAREYFPSQAQVPMSNQNITAVELDVSNVFPEHRLVVINTHFSILGTSPRRVNTQTLGKFVKELAWKTYLLYLGRQKDAGVSATANLTDPDTSPSFLSDVSVLLCGDFNLDMERAPGGYRKLKTLYGSATMRDLFLPQHNPNYAVQYTYYSQEAQSVKQKKHGTQLKGNSLFPWPFKGRVDYMFAVDDVTLSADEVQELVQEFPPESVVGEDYEEMDIPILKDGSLLISFEQIYCLGMDIVAQRHGSELSDHWPVSARITIGAPSVDPQQLPKPRKWQLLRGNSFCVDSSYSGAGREEDPEEREKRTSRRSASTLRTAGSSGSFANRGLGRGRRAKLNPNMAPGERARLAQETGYKERLIVSGRSRARHSTQMSRGRVTDDSSDDEEKKRWDNEEDPSEAAAEANDSDESEEDA
ncbi:endonuclease exonuclease phosphatase family protein [Cystoisospora suis]|uniref:Endonuclease exonuclease phosphatase family protein n=1 Tax=Cystoisospora suis TaxID=483139 RepID=A0A2C6LC01_9APIC|nr:endonuclease exonuclease phosphatase family protein [Cystoisospora suis]